MIRFFKAFPKFIKTAFLSIFRHIAMSLSASSAVTITLILFSAFLMIAGNVSLFTNSIEDDLQIHVVLKADVKTQKKIDEAKDGLEKISGVRRVTFSDKDNELELMIKEKGKEVHTYEKIYSSITGSSNGIFFDRMWGKQRQYDNRRYRRSDNKGRTGKAGDGYDRTG